MYDDEQVKEKGGGVKALATFIVDKRNLFFLLYICLCFLLFQPKLGSGGKRHYHIPAGEHRNKTGS